MKWLTGVGVEFVVMQWKRKMIPAEDQIHDLVLLDAFTNKWT